MIGITVSQSSLIATIKAHIAKGDKAKDKAEQHYIAAGQHLKTLKAQHSGSWAEWEALLKTKIGIGKSRASELMQIADGRKTVEQVRALDAEKKRITRAKAKASPGRPGENKEPADYAGATVGADGKARAIDRELGERAGVAKGGKAAERRRKARERHANKRQQLVAEHRKIEEAAKAEAKAKAEQLAADLIKAGADLAQRVHAHLWEGDTYNLMIALRRGLKIDGHTDDVEREGNDADPEQSAEKRRQEFAALDDVSDPGEIPACLRRAP